MDFGFAKFISILEYVAKQKGKAVVFVDKWFPSSKLCSECGWKNESLTLKDREWVCIECGCAFMIEIITHQLILKEKGLLL
jgi:putative transposase